jgi:hypothetical protein
MRGRSTSARAMATRWRCPPESCEGKRVPCSAERPTRARASATRRAIVGSADAALRHERHGHDVAHTPARVQRGEGILEDRLDQARAGAAIHVGEALSVHQHLAGGGRQQAEDHAGEGGLAAAALADDAEHAAGGHGEGDVVDRDDVARRREEPLPHVEDAAQAADLDGGVALTPPAARTSRRGGCRGPRGPARRHGGGWRLRIRHGRAGSGRGRRSRHSPGDARHDSGNAAQRLVALHLAGDRDAGEQAARVGVLRVGEELGGRRALHDLAGIHDRDAVGDARHHAEVVRDEQDAEAELLLDAGQQPQDLRLDGDVERGGRLVGDEEFRVAHQRHGDHHALAQPAGELVRILPEPQARRGDADAAQQLGGAVHGLGARRAAVAAQHLGHLRAHRVGRVQARSWAPGRSSPCGRRAGGTSRAR